MFLGEYEHSIDAKGRMAVPAKYREQIQRGAVVSKGMGSCLSVYPMQRWEEKSAELAEGKSNEELREFERRIFPSAGEVELDAQGRMIIPVRLRAYAHLGNEVAVLGMHDHFEIWDRVLWRAHQEQLEASGGVISF